MRCCVSLRGVRSEAHAVHALMKFCSFTAVLHSIRLDISSSLPIQFHAVIDEPRRHTASTRSKGGHSMFGRSDCQLLAEQMTHMTCSSCVLIRRVSQWTKPPSSSMNIVQFLCQPVPPLDDQVRALQKDLRTQPSLQWRRFSCVALRAHRASPVQHTDSVG